MHQSPFRSGSHSPNDRQHPCDVVTLVDQLLEQAADCAASDVHFEPTADGMTVRFRLDGVMTDVEELPKSIAESVAQAGSAVASALDVLERDVIQVEGNVAEIDDAACIRCRICEQVCPFQAISYNPEEDRMIVDEVTCKGCGLCNAACFSCAIQQRHFKDKQLIEQVKGLLGADAA